MADNNKIEEEVVAEEAAVAEAAPEVKSENVEKANKKNADKKPGFFKRVFDRIKKFWKNYKSELKKITWFSRKQTFNSTLLVLFCMVVAAVFIGVLDLAFSNGLEGLGELVELIKRFFRR